VYHSKIEYPKPSDSEEKFGSVVKTYRCVFSGELMLNFLMAVDQILDTLNIYLQAKFNKKTTSFEVVFH
jgi:hypothetical protein